MRFHIECEQEADGRRLAGVPELAGMLCDGTNADEAMSKVETLALKPEDL